MLDKSKYYDDLFHPNYIYSKNNGETTKIKTIRLTQEELSNWDSKAIHEFLQGVTRSSDSIQINALKNKLQWLYSFLSEKCEIKGEIDPEDIERLKQIKEVM